MSKSNGNSAFGRGGGQKFALARDDLYGRAVHWVARMVRLASEPRLSRWMPTRSPRWQRWAKRMALATVMALALAYLPYRLLDNASARKAQELREQYQRTLAATSVLAEENERLRHQIEGLRSDVSAIEDIAREELGMVRPGEVIIRIEEAPAP